MKLKILYAYNFVLALVACSILFVSSVFTLGTKEDHEQTIDSNALTYFLSRLLISLLLSVGLSLAIFIINNIYKSVFKLSLERRQLFKISLIELLAFGVVSTLFILFGMYN
jgi:hypothetical protein